MAVARGSLRTPDLQPPATKGRDGLIPSGFRALSFPTLEVEKEGLLLCSCLHHQRHLPPQKEGSFGFIHISPVSNYFQVVISPSHLYRLPVLFQASCPEASMHWRTIEPLTRLELIICYR